MGSVFSIAVNSVLFQPPTYHGELVWESMHQDQSEVRFVGSVCFSQFTSAPLCYGHIVYFHSNATDIWETRKYCRQLSLDTNCNVYAMEYPGYSMRATEAYSPQQCVQDAMLLIEHINSTGSNKPIVVLGESLGTAVATQAVASLTVARANVRRLVLVNPFTSVRDVADAFLSGASWFFSEPFDTAAAIQRVSCTVVICTSGADNVVPPKHSTKLALLLQGKKINHYHVVEENVGHNEFPYHKIVDAAKYHLLYL